MSSDASTHSLLMDAGSAAVRFNSPMSQTRAVDISTFVSAHAVNAVDLGCGRGALSIEMAIRDPQLSIIGIDSNALTIEQARALAVERSLLARVRFEIGDVSAIAQPADAALCIGSSHAFGGPTQALEAMRHLGRSIAVIGDLVWSTTPTQEHREFFGDLPHGKDGLANLAITAGWNVVERSQSSIDEWDEFELGWIAGVRDVGTPEAESFANERFEGYQSYRGVAGFGWLFLTH